MNTLRLFTNAIKANTNTNCTVNLVHRRQLKQEQICYMKRAVHNAATAVFIRNRNTTTPGEGNKWKRQQLGLLWPQQSWCTSTVASRPPSTILSKREFSTKQCPDQTNKSDTKSAVAATDDDLFGEAASKLGLFAKFKLMYKKYWYVLVPVHVVTSVGWFGGFYYLSQSGVDVPAVLQYLHLSETIIEKVQGSSLGHWAIAYLCYKVATPLRYAVTLGGTTVSIKYLVQKGHIKPIPTKAEFIQMYEDKKAQRAADKASKESASSSNPQQQQEKHPHEQK